MDIGDRVNGDWLLASCFIGSHDLRVLALWPLDFSGFRPFDIFESIPLGRIPFNFHLLWAVELLWSGIDFGGGKEGFWEIEEDVICLLPKLDK